MISIIVPIFRVEPFLDVCILSLIRQSYADLEIILVDDGSPDCSGSICDHYAQMDSRIQVVHKECGGPSDARNAGLEIARGEYIGFVDSDDYVASDMFEHLLKLIEDSQADISICGHVKTSHHGKPNFHFKNHKTYLMNREEALKKMLQLGYYESFVWNKLFRRELFDNVRFPEGRLYEDLFTTYKLIHLADRIVYSTTVKYYYRQRLGSIIHTVYNAKYYDYVCASSVVRSFIARHYPKILGIASFAYYRAKVFTFARILLARPQMLLNTQWRRNGFYKYARTFLTFIR